MFGGVGFGEVEHVVLRIEYDDPALRERFAEDRIAGTRGRLPAEGVVHAACERDGAADEHCLTVAAVFGLREQVGGREVGEAPSSASTSTSDGPAGRSMAVPSAPTSCLARVT